MKTIILSMKTARILGVYSFSYLMEFLIMLMLNQPVQSAYRANLHVVPRIPTIIITNQAEKNETS